MNFHLGKHPSGNGKHSRVRNNQRIRADFLKLSEIFLHTVQIPVMCKNIGRNINPDSMLMGKFYSFPDFFVGKILCLGAQAKGLSAQINRVRSVIHRRF